MTTDRELLELAAKAAGITLYQQEVLNVTFRGDDRFIGFMTDAAQWPRGWFDPLTDGADALRLAATLKADVKYHDGGVSAYIEGCQQGHFEDIGDDLYAATRRAITRAAAEIGRNMT